ncbi:LacI family DNA-binding transcriptional regulator [Sphingomonas sp. BGYR3]|uniref:LacI family DNA-binding transcriptional regulator n=1 Tax=Sphingomonas sp. BGYR3 TaxID=2975483 RepID=UPI0021A28666|nr:LacI family DNA-binding transcriptional regulator [Sphingomonas sp. BGYR3]MDG5488041.1 LacI family DNA-binding transcriptional regulator [Sphingomonas sp. BGYR3]
MTKSPPRLTSVELAERAGVSQPTVSRALRNDPSVAAETRERIQAIAREMGYSLNVPASRLRTGRTQTLALVVLAPPGGRAGDVNPFYLSLLSAISVAAAEHGYSLLVSFQGAGGDPFFGAYEDSGLADGVIVIGSGQNRDGWAFFARLAEQGKRIAAWTGSVEGIAAVHADNRAGGRLATERLIARGCSRILFLGPSDNSLRQFGDRCVGYRAAMAAAGLAAIEVDPVAVPFGGDRESYGIAAIEWALGIGLTFDGVFAASDLVALGAMQRLQEAGISVPGAVPVIGFDGIRAGLYASPPLTTIEQDYDRAGDELVELMLAMLDGREFTPAPVPVRLLERASA